MSGRAFARREHIPVRIMDDPAEIDREIAGRIAALVRSRADEGKRAVLGLATGSTPVGIYRELIRLHCDEGLDFTNVVTFNLDEYWPMDPASPHSYHRFMRENLFDHVNVPASQIHIPRGDVPRDEIEAHCRDYEARIADTGGIDFQLLGIGRSGHVGFNEPGSGRESRTRLLYLDTVTRADAAADFFGEDNVPLEAITMGVATILAARTIALVATGEHKAAIVQRAVEGEVHPDVAATFLQQHADATVYLDHAAAAELTRVRTPWVVGEVDWTPDKESEAVVWLSQQTNKPILHLGTDDYRGHHLSSLVARYGGAEPLNGQVFNRLIAKIRGRSKLPRDERVVVFSPHPDDDVISMGGVLRKLVQNGNDLTVAYQTSGNIAVFDHEVRRYLDFMARSGQLPGLVADADLERTIGGILERLAARERGSVDDPIVQQLKRTIRETEAVSALESVGLDGDHARFLDLPFYRTGMVRKEPIGEADIELTLGVLRDVRPSIVFAAGDLSDPHGTHRLCFDAVHRALGRYEGEAPELWLYRGAWQEWSVNEATVLVPLSEDELRKKIMAIFKHQSQKDVAPFPGPDPREFWERVKDRNRGTAELLRALGLPAYFAIEAYVTLRGGDRLESTQAPTSSLGEGV